MLNSRELEQKRIEVEKEAKALLDKVKETSADFTVEQTEQFQKFQTEIESYDDKIKNAKNVEAFEASLASKKGSILQDFSKKEKKNFSHFSYLKFIREAAHDKLTGIELEIHQEAVKDAAGTGKVIKGFGMIPDVLGFRKDVTITEPVAGPGGNLVGEGLTGFIELLRNNLVVAGLGVEVMSGLVGNIAIPKQIGGATAEWKGEQVTSPKFDQVYDQVLLSPKRITAYSVISKQLAIQSTPSAEKLAQDDLFTSIAEVLDSTVINGTGIDPEPVGIVTFGTPVSITNPPTHGDYIDMETALRTANIKGNLNYLTTPAIIGSGKQTSKDAGSGMFLIENNQVNGYNITASNHMPANTVIMGDFSQIKIGNWGVLDFIVDPYTLATESSYRLIIDGFYDIKSRYDEAFQVGTFV